MFLWLQMKSCLKKITTWRKPFTATTRKTMKTVQPSIFSSTILLYTKYLWDWSRVHSMWFRTLTSSAAYVFSSFLHIFFSSLSSWVLSSFPLLFISSFFFSFSLCSLNLDMGLETNYLLDLYIFLPLHIRLLSVPHRLGVFHLFYGRPVKFISAIKSFFVSFFSLLGALLVIGFSLFLGGSRGRADGFSDVFHWVFSCCCSGSSFTVSSSELDPDLCGGIKWGLRSCSFSVFSWRFWSVVGLRHWIWMEILMGADWIK